MWGVEPDTEWKSGVGVGDTEWWCGSGILKTPTPTPHFHSHLSIPHSTHIQSIKFSSQQSQGLRVNFCIPGGEWHK